MARLLIAMLVGAVISVGGCSEGVGSREVTSTTVESPDPDTRDSTPVRPPVGGSSIATAEVEAAEPTRIRIPVIGVDAPVIPLGVRDDGRLEVPAEFDETGWWVDGPEPGEAGPAVIVGHIDSRRGPAVFYDLPMLEPGDRIHIDRRDGTTVVYVVERTEQHPKNAFPTESVYGPTPDPVLRLVTCGGAFDRDRRSYEDNIIVFARLADP